MIKYKNLVRSKAHAYFIMGAETEDLLQEGMIGLFKAIRDYDQEKNDSFYLLNLNSISFLFQEMMKAKHNI